MSSYKNDQQAQTNHQKTKVVLQSAPPKLKTTSEDADDMRAQRALEVKANAAAKAAARAAAQAEKAAQTAEKKKNKKH
ncbi:unnamed protein product [Caenorhabditis sp. 36 PRJEB53466]|nr:unnamed protein product [Caenorhabditis sp. 36 PRJEB53466]